MYLAQVGCEFALLGEGGLSIVTFMDNVGLRVVFYLLQLGCNWDYHFVGSSS